MTDEFKEPPVATTLTREEHIAAKAPTKEELKAIQQKSYEALLKALQDGKVSPQMAKKLAKELGYRVHVRVAGRKDNSKYTIEQLREMRRKNGVGRKKNASQSE